MARPATDTTAPDNAALTGEQCLVTTQFRRDLHQVREASKPREASDTREASVATHVFHPSRPMGSIGDYDLAQQLGRSMFVGIHRATGQAFAIRLLDPPARPDQLGRQLSAASAFASTDHPNVVRTIEVGLHEGHVYLVMELLRGTPLEALLELHGALSSAQAIRIAAHVARGLEAAHLRGVVHRSLDASSVIVVPSPCGLGEIKVVDFALAPADDAVRIARHSMSPELVGGGRVDHRTDLYSLGVMLHRACTLRYPFEGSSIDILAMYRFRSMVRPAPELAGVPPELAGTIERCLAVEPAARFQTAGEVIQALRVAAGELARRSRPSVGGAGDHAMLLQDLELAQTARGSSPEVGPDGATPGDLTPPGMVRGEITEVPGRAVASQIAREASSQVTARGSSPRAMPQVTPAPAPALQSGRVMAPVDPASEQSGELIAPSGPRRVATALPLDASRSAVQAVQAVPSRGAAPARAVRRGAVWVPVAILAAAFAMGALLSLYTKAEGEGAQVAQVAAATAPPAPAVEPAAAAAAAPAAPAPAPAAAPTLAVPSCPPALEPDVVLSADPAPTPAPVAEPAPAVEPALAPAPEPIATLPAPEAVPPPVEAAPPPVPATEEPPRETPRKSRARKSKATSKATSKTTSKTTSKATTERRAKRAAAKRAAPKPADDEPISGETIDVSDDEDAEADERPRSRSRRRRE